MYGSRHGEAAQLRDAVAGRLGGEHREVVAGVEGDDRHAGVEQFLKHGGDLPRHFRGGAAFAAGLLGGDAVDVAGLGGNLNAGVGEPLVFLDRSRRRSPPR